jgi:hypothetical protein
MAGRGTGMSDHARGEGLELEDKVRASEWEPQLLSAVNIVTSS